MIIGAGFAGLAAAEKLGGTVDGAMATGECAASEIIKVLRA